MAHGDDEAAAHEDVHLAEIHLFGIVQRARRAQYDEEGAPCRSGFGR
ncbi:hypothetical protein [Streptomyces sp. YGL11-2]